MRSDDLTAQLLPQQQESPFRQGQILSFDPITGNNTVDVGGATLTDLPLLNIGDVINLGPGDPVILIKFGAAWAILGRVIPPGPSALQPTAVDFDSRYETEFTDQDLTDAFIYPLTMSIPTPAWANNALVFAISVVQIQNTSGAAGFGELITDINGSGGGNTNILLQPGDWQAFVHAQSRELYSAALGGAGPALLNAVTEVRPAVKHTTAAATWVAAFKSAVVTSFVLFRQR